MEVSDLNVSRETLDQLRAFAGLVEKWTTKINLVSKASVPVLWQRHILDSAQIYSLAPPFQLWVDIGSGGGFPGIVVAILANERSPDAQITLIESDQRKATFLRTVARTLELRVTVITERIEALESQRADVVSARALADLTTLLGYADLHLLPSGIALFPKGQAWQKEDDAARRNWSYSLESIKSKTNADAAILKIKDISRV